MQAIEDDVNKYRCAAKYLQNRDAQASKSGGCVQYVPDRVYGLSDQFAAFFQPVQRLPHLKKDVYQLVGFRW